MNYESIMNYATTAQVQTNVFFFLGNNEVNFLLTNFRAFQN